MKPHQEPLVSSDPSPAIVARRVSDARSIPETRGESLWRRLDSAFIRLSSGVGSAIPAHLNPFAQMGAVANTSFAIALASGILLLFWYSPSVVSAYDSVEAMNASPYLAGLMRSLHRYSSDLCMLFIVLHGFQTLFSRKFGGARWLAWLSGMILIGLIWVDGWTGYWLVWDERARQVALGTARLLDVLPILPDPLLRSFLTNESLNSLFFFIIFFIHMLIPLGMGVFLWIHIMRINKSKFFTGRHLTAAILGIMIVAALVQPAESVSRAEMTLVPQDISIDWYYLLPLYMTDRLSGLMLWAIVAVSTVLLFGVPWWLTRRRTLPAIVDEIACNGCTQCYHDCPFNAVELLPRKDGRGGEMFARIDPAKCVACGICVGSCDSSGIDQARLPLLDVRRWVNLNSDGVFVAFLCGESAAESLTVAPDGTCDDLPGYRIIPVPCAGWVHMLTVERAIRRGARGVLIAGCSRDPVCRTGSDWTQLRLRGDRGPELRTDKVSPELVRFVRFDRTEKQAFLEAAAAFRDGLSVPVEKSIQRPWKRKSVAAVVAAGLTISTVALSDADYVSPSMASSELVVSFKLAGEIVESSGGEEESGNAVLPHMRRDRPAERIRSPVRMRITVDGIERLDESFEAGGLFSDGSSIAIEEIPIDEGSHLVLVELGTSADPAEWTYVYRDSLAFERSERRVVLFQRGFEFKVE